MSAIKDRLTPDTIIQNSYEGFQRHSPRFIVGYWSIRGLGAPIRMLLSAAQVDHWAVMYDAKETAEDGYFDLSSWSKEKAWIKKEFPLMNLPYLVDCANDRVISQSNAILSYLGRELQMLGTTKEETSMCEELLCEIMDLRNLMTGFAYKPDQGNCEKDAKELIANANAHFKKLERHLMKQYPDAKERDGVCVTHLVGNNFTAPDFHLWEMLDQFEGVCKRFALPNCLGDTTTCCDGKVEETDKKSVYPFLKQFCDNFIKLPANNIYALKYGLLVPGTDDDGSDRIVLPYNYPSARFGALPDPTMPYTRGQSESWQGKGIQKNGPYVRIETGIDHWDDEAAESSAKN